MSATRNVELDRNATRCGGAGTSPTVTNNELSTDVSSFAVPCSTHEVEPGAGVWCMGQSAWSPCEHRHSRACLAAGHNTTGTKVSVAAWQHSHTAAIDPSARRRQSMAT